MVARDAPRIVLDYFLCGGCGYGVAVRVLPDKCPMCRSSRWIALDAAPRR